MPSSTHDWFHTMAGEHLQPLLAHRATVLALSGFSGFPLLPSRLHGILQPVLHLPLASLPLATKSERSGQVQGMKRKG